MIRIAFYGKGGIGKSTIAANVAAALAAEGKRVLHIGCDPKADSSRILYPGKVPTVLKQVAAKGGELCREDILMTGYAGVCCIEAGGPTAGSGCAGMGITVMEDELTRLGILQEDWDVIIYDVLGDVVCGGFAMPIRRHYADLVYVVTSADFMSLYAANNILKGVTSFARSGKDRFGGILLNHCHSEADRELVQTYCDRTGAELMAVLQESRELRLADYRGQTVFEFAPDSTSAAALRSLAEKLLQHTGAPMPKPMDEESLEAFGSEMAEKEICHG